MPDKKPSSLGAIINPANQTATSPLAKLETEAWRAMKDDRFFDMVRKLAGP